MIHHCFQSFLAIMSTPASRILKKKHIRVKLRANEPLLSVFMWGINHTVSLTKIWKHQVEY